MVKSMKNRQHPSVVGAKVVGGTIGIVLSLVMFVFAIAIPFILLATYYYSYDLVKFLQDNKNCNGCLRNDYYCGQVLRYTPIPLMVILVLNILLVRVPVHKSVKQLVSVGSFVMYAWFISCLYFNMKHITETNCACAVERKLTIDRLYMVSTLLLALLVLSVVFSVIGMLILLISN